MTEPVKPWRQPYADSAYRCSDVIRQAIVDGHAGRFVAIRLSDGGSDGVIYDSRPDAVRHQLHESLCAYIKVPWDDMSPRNAERFLAFVRQAHDGGLRMADVDGPGGDTAREIIMPMGLEDLTALLADYRRKGHDRL
jgi:hypothetical protein